MALSESNISVELREISLKKRPNALYKISSKATVPVLQINDKIIDESLEIMVWAINQSNCSWLNIYQEQQIELITNNDTKFKYWLDRYKYSNRFPESTFSHYQIECGKILYNYDSFLNDNKYLFGDSLQLADVAIFPFIRQCENVDPSWFEKNFKHLNRWLKIIKISSLFISVMGKYDLWNELSDGEVVNYYVLQSDV